MIFAKICLKGLCGIVTVQRCTLIALAALIPLPGSGTAASDPKTVAEIALYQGTDREKILIQGARREGNFTLYVSNSWIARTVASEFGKKYPFIKVVAWHAQSSEMVPRVLEEYAKGQLKADAIETSEDTAGIFRGKGIYQEYYTPEAAFFPEDVKVKGKIGIYCLGSREIYNSLGFNTKLVSSAEAPKTHNDLLGSKWKGKMSITGASMGVRWIGNVLHTMGMEYLEKLSRQSIKVHKMGPGALGTLVIAGEVPLSPTITDFTFFVAKQKGAPVEWRPLEPVLTNVGLTGITTATRNPHAAMLFIDYLHSKEGQKVAMQGGLSSPRLDIGSLEKTFKKDYGAAGDSPEEFERKYNEWNDLLKRLFIQKR